MGKKKEKKKMQKTIHNVGINFLLCLWSPSKLSRSRARLSGPAVKNLGPGELSRDTHVTETARGWSSDLASRKDAISYWSMN
jgi:hypothetical protein